jgi:asparagine synthase (glutamine-hydrolysing)
VGHKNDVDFAREVAERFGCEHHELTITGAIIADELACALETLDEPFGGAITSFWLSRFIASQVKVALSGDGADELFGSYAAHRHAATVRAFGAEVAFGAWRTRFCAFTDEEKRELFADDDLACENSSTLLQALFAQHVGDDAVNAALEVDCRTLLPDQVLTYADRLAMAHGLEVRSPFLDWELVRFVGTLPGTYKVTTRETKRLLRAVGRRFLPASVVDRPKEGFVLPLDAWLRTELRTLLRDALSPACLTHGLFKVETVERLVREHLEEVRDHTYKLWTLLAFQLWYRRVLPRFVA